MISLWLGFSHDHFILERETLIVYVTMAFAPDAKDLFGRWLLITSSQSTGTVPDFLARIPSLSEDHRRRTPFIHDVSKCLASIAKIQATQSELTRGPFTIAFFGFENLLGIKDVQDAMTTLISTPLRAGYAWYPIALDLG